MRRFALRLWPGWLALGLTLSLAPAALAQPTTDMPENASLALGSRTGLIQSARSNRRPATSGTKIRLAVRQGFIAVNAANKKLFACKWGSCTKAGKALRKTAGHWLLVLRPMKGDTKTVAKGLAAARTSLGYWGKTGQDAVKADAAAKAKKQTEFDAWYKRYSADYKLGVYHQNRAVKILSPG